MNFEFTENTVINIPLTYKGYRLEEGEKVRFRCCFKNYEGDFPYTLDMEEDNKGEAGSDGKFTVTLDMGRYGISPGRYDFDLSLVLESGSLVTLMSKNDNHINITPAAEGLDKPNGEVFFGADFVVETGSKDGISYRKWASGDFELWGGVVCNFGHQSYLTGSVSLPYKISDVNITATIMYDVSENIGAMRTVKAYMEKGSVVCMIYSDEHFASDKTLNVFVSVKGRWK